MTIHARVLVYLFIYFIIIIIIWCVCVREIIPTLSDTSNTLYMAINLSLVFFDLLQVTTLHFWLNLFWGIIGVIFESEVDKIYIWRTIPQITKRFELELTLLKRAGHANQPEVVVVAQVVIIIRMYLIYCNGYNIIKNKMSSNGIECVW